MAENWTEQELRACVATYLWMLRAGQDGFTPVKSRVHEALLLGPLSERKLGAIQYRLRNISHVLDQMSEPWIKGYHPASNVGIKTTDKIKSLIDWVRSNRARRRQPWLVNALPADIVQKSANQLAGGVDFDFPDSTTYDVRVAEASLPPKKIIGFAGQLFYKAPIYPDIQTAGDHEPTFLKLREVGLPPKPKALDPEGLKFREAVRRVERKQERPPAGSRKPKKREQATTAYVRDPAVVSYVEHRAHGYCELCGDEAPFERMSDGTPFLEVHHIMPLSKGGADVVENAAALCPNCHKACHFGKDAENAAQKLLRIAKG